MTPPALYKTTIVIWSEYDSSNVELEYLAFQATEGDAYCSSSDCVYVDDPPSDPSWDGTEFFNSGYDDEGKEE